MCRVENTEEKVQSREQRIKGKGLRILNKMCRVENTEEKVQSREQRIKRYRVEDSD